MATTTTIKNEYEFLPEIWNLIKEYAVPKPYDHCQWDIIYTVSLPYFFETVDDKISMEDWHKFYLVVEVESDGERGNDTTRAYMTKNPDSYRLRRYNVEAEFDEEDEPNVFVQRVRSQGYTFRAVRPLLEMLASQEDFETQGFALHDLYIKIEFTERGHQRILYFDDSPIPYYS